MRTYLPMMCTSCVGLQCVANVQDNLDCDGDEEDQCGGHSNLPQKWASTTAIASSLLPTMTAPPIWLPCVSSNWQIQFCEYLSHHLSMTRPSGSLTNFHSFCLLMIDLADMM